MAVPYKIPICLSQYMGEQEIVPPSEMAVPYKIPICLSQYMGEQEIVPPSEKKN